MNEDDRQKFYRFKAKKWIGPLYYDHPDGEDLIGKLSFCGQVAFFISAPIGLYNAYTIYPYPTTQHGRFFRLFRAVVPGVGMGLAFAVTTYYMTRIRQKDDAVNHICGGIAAGTICGAANGLRNGVLASLVFGSLACAFKLIRALPPQPNYFPGRQVSPFLQRAANFSKIPPGEVHWVKAPPPQN